MRPLSLFDICCIGVNAIVGTSIFLFPGLLAQQLGPASFLAFGLTGLALAPVALCFAEASLGFDRHGGPYLYASAAFGREVGFAAGWLCWAAEVLSWAAVAAGIAAYLGYFDAAWASPSSTKAIAAVVIAGMGALNYRGVKLGAWAADSFTIAKLVPLAVFVALGLPHWRSANFIPFAPHGWAPLGKACFLAAFAFSGFEVVPVPAGELRDPHRAVPIAVVGSLILSGVLYMLIQATAVATYAGLAGSERPLADAAKGFLGPWGASMIVAGAVISMVGFNAGCALGGPRYLVALAEDGHLPAVFARLHPRFRTPYLAVALTSVLALIGAVVLDFGKLVDFSLVVICAQYASTCAAVPFLRKRDGAWRLPGGWLFPALGIAATIWIGSQSGIVELKWSAVTLILGFVLRAIFLRL